MVQVEETERNLLPTIEAPELEPEPEPEPATYTVTLDPNGGTVYPTSVEMTVGSTYDLPTPTRFNHKFTGWYLGDSKIINGDVVTLSGDCTLVAMWSAQIIRDPISKPIIRPDPGIIPTPTPIKPPISTYSTGSSTASVTQSAAPVSDAGPTDELISYTKTYTYDLAGNRTGFALKKGSETIQDVTYTYDNLNRLSTVSEGSSLQAAYTYDANGNRVQMTATGGSLSSVTTYTYDAGNHLLTETRAPGNAAVETTAYTYDGSGNLLERTSARADGTASTVSYRYNGFNQLTACIDGGTTVFYAYNARGIRTAKQAEGFRTAYLLDGGDVVAEVRKDAVIGCYLRGANLIRRESGVETEYYLFNAHGDVVQLTDDRGNITGSYDYDAFGNEKNPDSTDYNPFRYCGEYFDTETGTYYLRARYYDPAIGRFTQEDTHWNTANMIYGDNPQKINQRQDALGLKTYTHVPQITAIMQAGNLYVYGVNNPVMYVDHDGHIAFMVVTALVGVVIGGVVGAIQSHNKYGEVRWQNVAIGVGVGGTLGLLGGAAVGLTFAGSATASASMIAVGIQLKVAGMSTVGYASFELFKKAYGSAGKGMAWHHIVQQTALNIERFGAEMIHNAANIVKIPHGASTLHQMITNHYNSIQSFTGGLRVYQWLQMQSFNVQYAYGLKILTKFAKELGITIQFVK